MTPNGCVLKGRNREIAASHPRISKLLSLCQQSDPVRGSIRRPLVHFFIVATLNINGLEGENMRKIIGPDVSFYQDSPTTPQGINFVRMNQVTDFAIVRAGQHLGADSDFRTNWA